VETLLLGAHDGHLTYRVARCDLRGNDHPDSAARRLAGFTADQPPDGGVLHSTSWRFAGGQIVLTYAALPDPDPGTATVLHPPAEPARGIASMAPSPPQVDQADVVAHACRHLAFLHHTDPVVAAAGRRHPELWTLLASFRPDLAGQLTAPLSPSELHLAPGRGLEGIGISERLAAGRPDRDNGRPIGS
jgi:hypothetical protein